MTLPLEIHSGVGVKFMAQHQSPFAGFPHFHEWTVWAWWAATEPLVDGRARQRQLAEAVRELGSDLNQTLGQNATNEGVAEFVAGRLPGLIAVRVVREAELLDAWAVPV